MREANLLGIVTAMAAACRLLLTNRLHPDGTARTDGVRACHQLEQRSISSRHGGHRADQGCVLARRAASGSGSSFSAPSLRGGCCSFFPRMALAGLTDVS